jgi:hypothetical protein
MEEARVDGEVIELHFTHLPTEIHEHIIRYCGVGDVASLALVNRLLSNVIRSKLRDFLISGCKNGTLLIIMCSTKFVDFFEDIDRLYEFPTDDPHKLWKVVRTIRKLDNFRKTVIRRVRWDVFKDCNYDKRRVIYVPNPQKNCLMN